jgi:hypothetical protein
MEVGQALLEVGDVPKREAAINNGSRTGTRHSQM